MGGVSSSWLAEGRLALAMRFCMGPRLTIASSYAQLKPCTYKNVKKATIRRLFDRLFKSSLLDSNWLRGIFIIKFIFLYGCYYSSSII